LSALAVLALPCVVLAQGPEQPSPAHPAANQGVEQLIRQVETGIQQSDAALGYLGQRIPELRERVERLTDAVQSIQAPDAKEPDADEAPPRKVQYRPPMERMVQKDPINFHCEERRISVLDFKAVDKFVEGLKGRGKIQVNEELPGSDFRLEGYVQLKADGKVGDMELAVMRRPDCPGETYEQIQRPGSRFQKAITSGVKPDSHVVKFSVWPDSYETFRKARALAWKAGYDVGWNPMEPGEKTKLVRGAVAGQNVQ
jgi:hypothetical protein